MPGGLGLLTIGEFAGRSGLSIRALRLYDRIGLLQPAHVVPATGYRRYASRQLYAGRLIALLRRLDMPLTEITTIVSASGPTRPDDSPTTGQQWNNGSPLNATSPTAWCATSPPKHRHPTEHGRCLSVTLPNSTSSARCATSTPQS